MRCSPLAVSGRGEELEGNFSAGTPMTIFCPSCRKKPRRTEIKQALHTLGMVP